MPVHAFQKRAPGVRRFEVRREGHAHVPRADAKWLGRRLSLLSNRQIGDGFRAGGYTDDEIAIYTKALRARIAELKAP